MNRVPLKPDRDRRRDEIAPSHRGNECFQRDAEHERRIREHEARVAAALAGAPGRGRLQPKAIKAALSKAAKATREASGVRTRSQAAKAHRHSPEARGPAQVHRWQAVTRIAKLLAGRPDLARRFAERAADPAVSGDMLLAELQAAGLPARRSAVFAWRKQYRAAERHRPNSLAGRVASALRSASAGQLAAVRLPAEDTTAAVFKLGRKRLYAVARQLGLYPPVTQTRKIGASAVNDA